MSLIYDINWIYNIIYVICLEKKLYINKNGFNFRVFQFKLTFWLYIQNDFICKYFCSNYFRICGVKFWGKPLGKHHS